MAVFEGTHGELLQGVSQQIPRSRLEGQVTEQVNMISDPVKGLRRRQGCKFTDSLLIQNIQVRQIKAWRTEVGGAKVEFLLCTRGGKLHIYENGVFKKQLQSDYLVSPLATDIRYATVGESLYIANTIKVPQGVEGTYLAGETVGESGFANFQTGALNREFQVSVRVTKGSTVKEIKGSYTTPNGEKPEDVNKITPENIAKEIHTKLAEEITKEGLSGQISLHLMNEVIAVRSKDKSKVRVLANASDMYIVTSNLGNLKDVGKLPDKFPDGMDGVSYSVGKDKSIRYYKFNQAKGVWEETADTSGFIGIKGMPVEVYYSVDTGDWVINEDNFAGRLTGDKEGNPDPDFIGWGITGIASYQSRLVILSGSYVWLSASGLPRLFYRTTMEELLDTDPIGVGSSSATSASFQYAVNFNKDLVLFSSEHQAIIAGSNIAITPRTANVMLTSSYTTDMTVEPIDLGRTLMYPMPRSADNYGILEMLPSPYTDSQYVSTDVTEHIPTYLKGRCRIAVSSTVGSIALFGSTDCLRTLYVYEYVWKGEEKALQSWHKWVFPKDIADVYFNGDLITIIFAEGDLAVKATVDPRTYDHEVPEVYLDFNKEETTGAASLELTQEYSDFVGQESFKVVYADTGLAGSTIGFDRNGRDLVLNKSIKEGVKVKVGIPYESKVIPTPPVVRDYQGDPIATNRLNLISYYCITDNSGTYTITIKDKARAALDIEYDRSPVKWYSTELNLGQSPVGGLTGDVVPCRVPANSSDVTFSTNGTFEMNIVALEYVCMYNYRRQRR